MGKQAKLRAARTTRKLFTNFSPFKILTDDEKNRLLRLIKANGNFNRNIDRDIDDFVFHERENYEFYCTCEVVEDRDAVGIVFYKIIRDGEFNFEAHIYTRCKDLAVKLQDRLDHLNRIGAKRYADFLDRYVKGKLTPEDKQSWDNLEPLIFRKLLSWKMNKSVTILTR